LKVAYEHIKPEARKLELLGHGNGFSFEASPFCSYAQREGIHVVLAGEVAEWPGISAVAAAHDGKSCSKLLDGVQSFALVEVCRNGSCTFGATWQNGLCRCYFPTQHNSTMT
jgi:hypothetical protein